jgi:hypothetical protein
MASITGYPTMDLPSLIPVKPFFSHFAPYSSFSFSSTGSIRDFQKISDPKGSHQGADQLIMIIILKRESDPPGVTFPCMSLSYQMQRSHQYSPFPVLV